VYSPQELKDRSGDAGYGAVAVYRDLERNEYGINARRLVAVATK